MNSLVLLETPVIECKCLIIICFCHGRRQSQRIHFDNGLLYINEPICLCVNYSRFPLTNCNHDVNNNTITYIPLQKGQMGHLTLHIFTKFKNGI